jgi:hypothetical protein
MVERLCNGGTVEGQPVGAAPTGWNNTLCRLERKKL